ncbi:MAG TPA: trigger factor [Candidatus Mcinerneyibacteriales bacterium]|nr:trigger factor [Candidatus Mcinerneyibacteriales bacterium]
MKLEIKKNELGRLGYGFEVTLEKKEFQKAYKNKLGYYANTMQIKGFRQGKAPLSMVEKIYGESIRSEAANDLLPKMIDQALKDEKIQAGTDPEVKDVKMEEDLQVTFDVFAQPEIEEIKTAGIKAALKTEKVTQDEIDKEIQGILEQKVTYEEIKDKEKSVEKGDHIYLDFEGFLEDGTPIEGGKAENYLLEAGKGNFIKDLDDNLPGMKAGEEKRVDVTFPEEYHAKHLAGAKAYFNVKVRSIVEKKYPELSDELAKEVSGLESVAALKERIETNLKEAKEDAAKNELRKDVFAQLLKKNKDFPLPGKLVDEELESLKKNNPDAEEKELRAQAEDSVRGYFLLHKIDAEEKIDITQKLQEEIAKFSLYFGKDVQATAKMLEDNGMLNKMAYDLWEKSALDKIIERVENKKDASGSAPAGEKASDVKPAAKKTAASKSSAAKTTTAKKSTDQTAAKKTAAKKTTKESSETKKTDKA